MTHIRPRVPTENLRMSWGYLLMRGRVLFNRGGPLGIDKVHSRSVVALCNRKRERNQRGRVHREIHDSATETTCSPGQHNTALSRTTWFECTSDGRGRDVQPHMHLLTTSYFHSHEWGPHTDSPHYFQTVRAKTFHNMSSTQCREKLFLGFAPSRTLREDRVCLQAARA